jgi:hypothetical protein
VFKSCTLTLLSLMGYLLKSCTSRLYRTRVDGLCMCGIGKNNLSASAFKEVLNSTKDVDLGSEWLKYAMKFMVEDKTRNTIYGSDVQKLRSGHLY